MYAANQQTQPEPASLPDTLIYLNPDGSIQTYPKQAESFRKIQQDTALANGRTLALFQVNSAEDVHYPLWEMHPQGAELLILLSGSLAVEL